MSRGPIKGNTRDVIRAHNFEKSLEYKANKTSNRAPLSEKEYGKELYELGKDSYFQEYFFDIKIENQCFPQIGTFDNPTITWHFQKGYQRGKEIIGFSSPEMIPEKYHDTKEYQELFEKSNKKYR